VKKIATVLVVGSMLAACSSGVVTSSPSPGVLSGVVLGHLSGATHQTPLANTPIGVYRRAVSSGGPVLQNPPQPVATTNTDRAGMFRFSGLPAGRWYVLAMDQAGQGSWVRFDPANGAAVTLVVCTDCPVPL
jgi:hypothetical protein